MARLFVGVWLPAALRDDVIRFMNSAERSSRGFKWTRSEQLHFTLKFLGEVQEERINRLNQELAQVAEGVPPFCLALGKPGCFPNVHHPRIVWLGAELGGPELERLAVGVENATLRAGCAAADKPFVAHLTLARSKPGALQLVLPDEAKFENQGPIHSFCLIESQLTPTGSIYRTRAEFPLKTP